jgi:transposase-like protein
MNLVEVIKEFKTDSDCRSYLESLRWPDGVKCLRCNNANVRRLEVPEKKSRELREIFECKICDYQFSVTAGTIFHDSHLPLTKWFLAVAMMCESKKGMSANQIKRALGVQYRTAWYLCHRIRKAMETGDLFTGKLGKDGAIVEADETYIGGKYDKRRKRGPHEKQAVMGIIERHGRIKAQAIPTPSKQVLISKVRENVSPDVKFVATDEASAYKHLDAYFRHETVTHSALEFVRGEVHTNSVENFWSLLKRGVIGSFHQISVKHLPRYINEFSYRFNFREDSDLFTKTLGHLVTTDKMTYAELIDKKKDAAPF